VDPSRIALNLHGKKTISENSFDPTKLLSTNKLGISPQSTTLTIRYRSNSTMTTSVAVNTITQIVSKELLFDPNSALEGEKIDFVSNSLEITNEEPINSINTSITIEELKQRAIAHYATQNRAVTKQDYESLVYNMPNKFGAIRRANIINDPSYTNRRIALYLISENSNGHLSQTGHVTKNNLKNWLLSYKMLNDVIDIMDAKVINFDVNFLVHVDKRYDHDSVLSECIAKVQEYFSEVAYIGEPIYLYKIYQLLNNITGVIDTKDVLLTNKSGGIYSSTALNFEDALSRDGTYIEIPQDSIFELKYPDLNIKGTAK
jgi:hypothetical protein